MARAKKEAALTPEERLQAALVPDWERPYKLPENWCWTTIKNVATVVTGGTPAKNNSDYYGGEFPFFKPADLDAGRHVSEASEYLSDLGKSVSRIIPAQATAVCCIGSIGKCGFLDVEGATNQQINSAIPYFNALYQYFYMNTEFFTNQLRNSASATTIAIVNKTKMESCYYPLAPLAEQQRIVDRIESLFAKLDEAKEKAQAVVDSFETRKAAILHKAFTGELTTKWREEHNISKTTWGEKKWGDFLQSIEAGKNWSAEGRPPEGTEFGVVKVSAVTWGEFDELESKTCVVAEQWNSKTQIHKGDFLFSRANTLQLVGNCVIVRNISKRLMLSDKILRFKFDEIAHPRFVLYFTRSRIYREQVEQLASGNQDGMRNISQKNLKLVSFPIPTVVEQIEIISILDRAFAKEQQSKEAAEAVLDQIDLMKKSILARAFRGELGTNDPNEERAVELLKKVLHTSAEPKSKTKRKFIPPKIEAQIKTDLERKIIMAFIQSDTAIMPIQQLMSVSSRKFDVIETLRNLQERGILLKENDTYRLMG